MYLLGFEYFVALGIGFLLGVIVVGALLFLFDEWV
jgi:hypothetical protein